MSELTIKYYSTVCTLLEKHQKNVTVDDILEDSKYNYTMLHHTQKPEMFSHERSEFWIGSSLPQTMNQSELYAVSSSLLIG